MSKKQTIDVKYQIENGNIILSRVSNFITCEVCGQNLAINNRGTILVKSFASLLDLRKREVMLKCGKCKSFNTIKLEDTNKRDAKCLLVV